MAIALVSTSVNSTLGGSTGTDLALSIPDAGAVIFAGFTQDATNPGGWPPVPRWDSSGANSTFTLIASRTSTARAIAAYFIVNPSTGTHSITFSDGGQSTAVTRIAHAVAYSGVDSTTPCDTATVSVNNNPSGSSGVTSTAIPSAVGDIVIGVLAVNAPAGGVTPGSGGTHRTASTGAGALGLVITEWAGAATVESTWTLGSTASNDHSVIAFNVNAAAAGGSTPMYLPRRRTLMGVGR